MPEFFTACLSPSRRSITPNGQAGTQYPQPLQTSSCTTTVSCSVRKSAPVGHTSRQAACVQCLHTSDAISQRSPSASRSSRISAEDDTSWSAACCASDFGIPLCTPSGSRCSTNATCLHVSASRPPVLSYELPVHSSPSSGTWFHSLHATSHALQPMHSDVSVKKPSRSFCSAP